MIKVRTLLAMFSLICLSFAGCMSGNEQAPATVSGNLSYNGQPLKGGVMKFHTPDGVAYNAVIGMDGTYTATDIPTGEMIVTVSTEELNPEKSGAQSEEAKRRMAMQQQPAPGATTAGDLYMKIPEKYADPKTTPLKYTVESGSQTKDFELTD